MEKWSFTDQELITASQALHIAEEVTGNHFKFSMQQWKRHRYDVKTLVSLAQDEISMYAFALLNKGSRVVDSLESRTQSRDYYFICLQDNQILSAVKRDRRLGLLPLLVYVFTHELVHIVRFCSFLQRYERLGKERAVEEAVVHGMTTDILQGLSVAKLDYVLESYQEHKVCELAV
jgi:hypothetical protein